MALTLPRGVTQLLFDDTWIADSRRLTRRWLPAKVFPEPVLQADQPWEGLAVVLYGSVLPQPGGGYRMYYSTFVPALTFEQPGATMLRPSMLLATSDDGLRWRKPAMNVVPFAGGPSNIVYQPGRHFDSPSVMYDPQDEPWPWKMIAFRFDSVGGQWAADWGMHGMRSRDGLAWEPVGEPGRPVLVAGDRSNLLCEKVDGEYWLYTRHCDMGQHVGCRAVYLSRSRDFEHWSEPQLVLAPDLDDEGDVEFYGMSVFRRHGWFLGLLEYWRGDADCIEVHLAVSRDGVHWQRPCRRPFIAATYPWNARWTSCASNGPIVVGDRMVFHFGGRFTSHHWDAANLHGAIGYASTAIDRFCAIEGLAHNGYFTTPAFAWPGGELALNADTRESFDSHPAHCNGELAVEVLDAQGRPIENYSGPSKALWRGNSHCRGIARAGVVTFADNRPMDALAGQAIRLRFHFRHARLFSFEAS